MRSYQVLPLRVRVDLGVMAMKRYSTIFETLGLKPHHQILFSVIFWIPIGEEALLPCRESKPTRVSSSLIGHPIHSALCHIEAKSFVNYYSPAEMQSVCSLYVHIYMFWCSRLFFCTRSYRIQIIFLDWSWWTLDEMIFIRLLTKTGFTWNYFIVCVCGGGARTNRDSCVVVSKKGLILSVFTILGHHISQAINSALPSKNYLE